MARENIFTFWPRGRALSAALLLCGGLVGWMQGEALAGSAQNPGVAKPRANISTITAAEDTSQFLSTGEMEEEYAIARSAMNAQEWVQALVALEMVLASDPNYRDAHALRIRAQQALEQDSTEARLARFYVKGMTAKRVGDLHSAAEALRAAQQVRKNFRDTAKQLAEVEQRMQAAPAAVAASAFVEVSADSLQNAARAAVARQDWRAAAALFAQLESLDPDNLALRKEAESARVNLLIAQTGLARVEARNSEQQWLQTALFLAMLILFLVLLALAFSFQLRVRYFLMRGRLRRAAQLYESALLRAPERLKLYPPLADLYLRTQRKDAAAMRVFKTVQQLNLPTPHRAAIDAVLAQHVVAPNFMATDEPPTPTPELRVEPEPKAPEQPPPA